MIDFDRFKKLQKTIFFSKTDLPYRYKKQDYSKYIQRMSLYFFKQKPSSVIELDRSTLHNLYKINVKNTTYLVRTNALRKHYNELSFFTEEWIMQTLKQHCLPSLKIFYTDVSQTLAPFDFQIVELAKGESLHDLVQNRGDHKKLFYKFGIIIGKLHKIKTQKFGQFDVQKILIHKNAQGIYSSWKQYIKCNLAAHIRYCNDIGAVTKEEVKNILSIFDTHSHLFQIAKPRLIHGDLANHNIMIHNNQISALIDWEDSLSGDPAFDIAYYGTGSWTNKYWFTNFIRGYKTIHELSVDFWQRYWLYFLRIALSKTVLRHKLGVLKSQKIDPGAVRIKIALQQML